MKYPQGYLAEILRDLIAAIIITLLIAILAGAFGCATTPKHDIKAIQQVPMVNHPQK